MDEARAYWAHPSQQIMGASPEVLPDDPVFQYWADGPICLVLHPTFWPGVWMVHVGVKPEGWGRSVDPARRVLRAFAEAERAERIIAWMDERNRAVIAFARRCGFEDDGRMPGVVMMGWRP